MRNPLNRRLPRELAKDWAKYAAIFILMVLLISICSGMRVSNESLKQAYYESFDKYVLEDGHLTFDKPLPDEMRSVFEEKGAMKLYDNFYFDEETPDGQVVRVYSQEDEINTPCLLSGEGKLSSQVQHIEDKNSRGERKPRHFLGRELIR